MVLPTCYRNLSSISGKGRCTGGEGSNLAVEATGFMYGCGVLFLYCYVPVSTGPGNSPSYVVLITFD